MNDDAVSPHPFRDQLEAYALGALDSDDAVQVEAHVISCAGCRQSLRDLEEAAAMLPAALALSGPEPPVTLKSQVMAAVAAAGDSRGAGDEREHVPPRPRWWHRNVTALTRLAAAALLLLSLGWSVRLALALEQERALSAEFAALVARQEIVLEVVDSDKTVRRVLRTTRPESCEPGTCPYGKLFTRTDLNHVVAMAARLPPPPAGEVYRLWLSSSGQTRPAGTMTLDDNGFGLLVFDEAAADPRYGRAELVLQPSVATIPAGDVALLWTPESD